MCACTVLVLFSPTVTSATNSYERKQFSVRGNPLLNTIALPPHHQRGLCFRSRPSRSCFCWARINLRCWYCCSLFNVVAVVVAAVVVVCCRLLFYRGHTASSISSVRIAC